MNFQPIFRLLPLFLTLFFVQTMDAQRTKTEQSFHFEDEHDAHAHDDDTQKKPSSPPMLRSPKVSSAGDYDEYPPSVNVYIEPLESGLGIVYHPVAAYNSALKPKNQVSLQMWVENLESKTIYLSRIDFRYTLAGVEKTQTLACGIDTIPPGEMAYNNNGRAYHAKGDVLYFDEVVPTTLIIEVYFKNCVTPVTLSGPLKPYNKSFAMPFRTDDLRDDEVWESASTHGGGDQVFGYDMGVWGYSGSAWSDRLPNKDNSKNEHYRVWGKAIRAMADGVVLESVNNCPENPKPGQKADFKSYTNGNGGNHFYIKHGDLVVLYAHFQKGSLNSTILAKGSVVKKGDFLGLAGNSGNSTGPHLHISARKHTEVEKGPLRPILFDQGLVIEKTALTALTPNAAWVRLDGKGIPGYEGKRSFVWPSNIKPMFKEDNYVGVFRASNDAQYFLTNLTKAQLVTQDNSMKGQGRRMTEIAFYEHPSVLGATPKFAAVWRNGTDETYLQTGLPTWQAFVTEWQTKSGQGFRLIDIETYTDDGEFRVAGLYTKPTTPHGHYLFLGMTQAQLQAKVNELAATNYRLVNVHMYEENEEVKYVGIWHPGTDNQQLTFATNYGTFYNQWKSLTAGSMRLVEYDYLKTGDGILTKHYYVGLLRQGTGEHELISKKTDVFTQYFDELHQKGLRLVDLHIVADEGPLGI